MKKRILIFDYSDFDREKIKYILSNISDFDIVEISDILEFSQIQNRLKSFDLIIIDINFPMEKDGFSIISQIRSFPETRNTPIIIITRSTSSDIKNIALKYSVNDFIQKPFKPSRLERSLSTVINIEKQFRYIVNDSAKIIMSFEEYFSKEINMAKRTKQLLSLILITLIKPKQEKLADSTNLSEISNIMDNAYKTAIIKVKQCLRITDYAVLNNRDIIVVLPNTGSMGAKVVNTKIIANIDSSLKEAGLEFDDLFYSTCVVYPDDGDNFQSLIETAFKKVADKEMLEKFTNILDEAKLNVSKRYTQFKKQP